MTPNTTPAAHRIADAAVITDIETGATRCGPGSSLYDTRPMLDANEHGPECIDMARQALDYAIARGLVHPSAEQPWLMRIVKAPT